MATQVLRYNLSLLGPVLVSTMELLVHRKEENKKLDRKKKHLASVELMWIKIKLN